MSVVVIVRKSSDRPTAQQTKEQRAREVMREIEKREAMERRPRPWRHTRGLGVM